MPAVLAVTMWGCARQDPQFSRVNPPDGKAVIYVYRQGELDESAVTFYISVDDQRIAGLRPNKYLYQVVDAGRHTVSCQTESESSVTLNARPGASYYIRAGISEGQWMGRPRLMLMNPQQAMAGIQGKHHYQGKPLPKDQFDMQMAGVEGNY